MGASLFLVVGPVNIGVAARQRRRAATDTDEDLRRTGRNGSNDSCARSPERRRPAARADPGPDQRRRAAASETRPDHGQPTVTPQAQDEFEKATQTWDRYLKQVKGRRRTRRSHSWSPRPASSSPRTPAGIRRSVRKPNEAAAACSGWSPRAGPASAPSPRWRVYELPRRQLRRGRPSPAEGRSAGDLEGTSARQVAKPVEGARKQGKKNSRKRKKEVAKAEKGKGKEALENPLGGLGGGFSAGH